VFIQSVVSSLAFPPSGEDIQTVSRVPGLVFSHAWYHCANRWLSIINSFVLVLLLTAFLAIILMRILKKVFSQYMEIDEVRAMPSVSVHRLTACSGRRMSSLRRRRAGR
jgi:hypothetical protein